MQTVHIKLSQLCEMDGEIMNKVLIAFERKLEHILIMSISSLYIQKHTVKAQCHRISRSFGRKPLFHVIESQFKVEEAWELERIKEPYRKIPDACHHVSGSFGRKPHFHGIVGLKGDIVKKTVVILKTPTSQEANSAPFFIRLLYSVNS